ncbi:hypothetical protein JHK82_024299 [Glycine max]|nr:hypothetical protein JHK87_024263 [Glycine soja]KAG5006338.1 hypothetical protein JHK85_024880 [Glycine max]KAG5012132.1 hypothetical protein JHK86_024393 [Glycine max]KAG5133111.1 hypothetical protein JHK82_024299 [Glycine max]
MPVNILLTFIIGYALGWILIKLTKAPKHLEGLIMGVCLAGNLGNLPIIIIPAICKDKGSPFGDSNVCCQYGMAYASLSMVIVSFIVGVVPQIRKLMIGGDASLHVIQDSVTMVGYGDSQWLCIEGVQLIQICGGKHMHKQTVVDKA